VFIAGVLVLLAVGVGTFAWRWADRGPGRASVDQAVTRFRTSSTLPSSSAARTPRPGVYVYRGTGSENLSFMNTHQSQGPTEPGTVTALPGGCWTFRLDFNSYHSQQWVYCSVGAKIVQKGGTADQKFDFVAFKEGDRGTTKCDPPFVVADANETPGTTWPVRCDVHSSTTNTTSHQRGSMTFVGPETVVVGGTPVRALHSRQDLQLSGGQTGTVHVDLWLSAADGLPLQEQHDIAVVSPAPAPIKHVKYTERGSWHATSLAPRR
jgi:hypothetical protein